MTTETNFSSPVSNLATELSHQLEFLKDNLKAKRGCAPHAMEEWIATIEAVHRAILEDNVTHDLVTQFTDQGSKLAGAIPSVNAAPHGSRTVWIVSGIEMRAQVGMVDHYATMLRDRVKSPWQQV